MPCAFRLDLAAAQFSLHLLSSDDLRKTADQLLCQGIYSHALGELGTLRHPTMAEAEPLFRRALRELGIPLPDHAEAEFCLLRYHVERMVEVAPLQCLGEFWREFYRPIGMWQIESRLHQELSNIGLVEAGYRYEDLQDLHLMLPREQYQEQLQDLTDTVEQAASQWLRDRIPIAVEPSWLMWNERCVARMAQRIAGEKRFEELPILADALEEAGCSNGEILNHCRLGSEHVRPRGEWRRADESRTYSTRTGGGFCSTSVSGWTRLALYVANQASLVPGSAAVWLHSGQA